MPDTAIILVMLLLCIDCAHAQTSLGDAYIIAPDFTVVPESVPDLKRYSKEDLAEMEAHAKSYSSKLNSDRDRLLRAGAYHSIVAINLELGDRDDALYYLYELLDIPGFKDSKGAIEVYWAIFKWYSYSGNTVGMLEQFSELRRLGPLHNFYDETEPENLNKVYGELIIKAGYYKEAKDFYVNQLLKDSLTLGPTRFAVLNNDLASIYNKFNQPDSVTYYRNKAFKSINSNVKDRFPEEYRNYIRDYIQLHDFWYKKQFTQAHLEFAKLFLSEAAAYDVWETHTSVYAYHYIATHFFEKGDYNQALEYINQAIKLGLNKVPINTLNDLFILKGRLLDALGQRDETELVIKQFNRIRDSLAASLRNVDLTRFEVEKIRDGQSKAEKSAIENENKFMLAFSTAIFTIAICAISIISLLVIGRSRKRLQLAKVDISDKLVEREMLLKELNHRVKNNLSLIISLIKFQSEEFDDPRYIEKLNNLEHRISAIAIAHEQFVYADHQIEGSFYDLEDYLNKICNALISISARTINYQQWVERIKVTIDTALPMGIIINELLSNSIEHAETVGVLDVELRIESKNEWIIMMYSDSGNNFEDKPKGESLGGFIIQSMVEQLNGKLVRYGSSYHIKLKHKE